MADCPVACTHSSEAPFCDSARRGWAPGRGRSEVRTCLLTPSRPGMGAATAAEWHLACFLVLAQGCAGLEEGVAGRGRGLRRGGWTSANVPGTLSLGSVLKARLEGGEWEGSRGRGLGRSGSGALSQGLLSLEKGREGSQAPRAGPKQGKVGRIRAPRVPDLSALAGVERGCLARVR